MKVLFFSLITAFFAVFIYVINKKDEPLDKLLINSSIITAVVFFLTIFSVQYIKYDKYQNKEFVLDSDKKYIIHRDSITATGEELFYEVDLENEEIVYRSSLSKRNYLGTIDEERVEEVARIISIIVSNEENLKKISDTEWDEFLRENAFDKYKIQTYDGEEYYVRGAERVKDLTQMLNDYKNKTALD